MIRTFDRAGMIRDSSGYVRTNRGTFIRVPAVATMRIRAVTGGQPRSPTTNPRLGQCPESGNPRHEEACL